MYQNLHLLNEILKVTPLPLAVYTGEDLIVEFVNPAMINAWGKGDNVIGKKYIEVVPEIKSQLIHDQAVEVYKTGVPFYVTDKRVDLIIDGTLKTHYYNYSFIPLFDPEGAVYAVMNTGTDVTELHHAKHQKELSEEKLIMAIESSGLGFYEADLKTKKVTTCGTFNHIWSVENQDMTSWDLISKIHPDDKEARNNAHEKAKQTHQLTYEARIIEKDDISRWVKVNGRYLYDTEGNPERIIGLVQDIHTQKEFEEELKKQITNNTQGLQRSNEDLLQFANIVSHDLREPIRKIKFFQDLLRKEVEPTINADIEKYFNKIHYSADRMNNMIEGVLAYSTLNNPVRSIKNVDLNEILEGIKTDLELVIMEKNAVFIADPLPKVEGSSILLHQLFYNLIQNALKFSKADLPPRITISSSIVEKEGSEYVQIHIKDNGIGLDIIFAERIFNEFERLHSKDQFQGNGLGLALCRKIVQRHNGTINAVGEIDNGAEFTVTLPLKQNRNAI